MRCNSELQNLTKGIAMLERLRPAPAWSALHDLRGLPEQNLARGGAQRMAHKETHGKGQEQRMRIVSELVGGITLLLIFAYGVRSTIKFLALREKQNDDVAEHGSDAAAGDGGEPN